jgi:hypothetical protein
MRPDCAARVYEYTPLIRQPIKKQPVSVSVTKSRRRMPCRIQDALACLHYGLAWIGLRVFGIGAVLRWGHRGTCLAVLRPFCTKPSGRCSPTGFLLLRAAPRQLDPTMVAATKTSSIRPTRTNRGCLCGLSQKCPWRRLHWSALLPIGCC